LPLVEVVSDIPALGPEDVLAVPVGTGGALPQWLNASAQAPPVSPELLTGALADTGNKGSAGTVTNVPLAGRRPRSVVAVGVGEGTLPDLRAYVATAVRRGQSLAEHGARRLVLPVDSTAAPAGAAEVRAAVEAALLAGYAFRLSSTPFPSRLATITVVAADAADPAVTAAAEAGRVSAEAVAWARDLVNTPSNVKNPAWLAEQALERLAACRTSRSPFSDRRSCGPAASAASSPSVAARRLRRASSSLGTGTRRPGPVTRSSSARGSPSTPAASRSSPTPACAR
jgi:hypothetical protein